MSRPRRASLPGCAGMWNDAQAGVEAHRGLRTRAQQRAIGLQLGHAGPRAPPNWAGKRSTSHCAARSRWNNWPLIAPSAVSYGPHNQVPRAMTREDLERVRDQFVRATRMGARCGFDILELHCAHGYLLSSFICPLTNQRTDEYGGSLDNRLRFPLEVFRAMRAVWPGDKPMSVRISAHDWALGGNTPDDAVEIARQFKAAGADLIDVSSGQTTRLARPVYGRMYQTPFSDRIRNEVGIATIAVGNIFEADHLNSIVAAGRAACARWRVRIWLIPAGRCMPLRNSASPKWSGPTSI